VLYGNNPRSLTRRLQAKLVHERTASRRKRHALGRARPHFPRSTAAPEGAWKTDPKTNPLHEPRFRRREQPRPSRGMERVSNAEHSECWCRGCIRNWCYSFSRSDDRALAQRHRGQGGGPPISTWRAELSRRRQGSFSLPGLPVGAATGSMAKSRRSRLPARSST